MDDQKADRESGSALAPKRRFLRLVLIALAVLCAASYPILRDLVLQMRKTARTDAKLEAKLKLVKLASFRHYLKDYMQEQNRLHNEPNWLERLSRRTESPPYSEADMQRQLKYYDDQIAEAEKELRDLEPESNFVE